MCDGMPLSRHRALCSLRPQIPPGATLCEPGKYGSRNESRKLAKVTALICVGHALGHCAASEPATYAQGRFGGVPAFAPRRLGHEPLNRME